MADDAGTEEWEARVQRDRLAMAAFLERSMHALADATSAADDASAWMDEATEAIELEIATAERENAVWQAMLNRRWRRVRRRWRRDLEAPSTPR